MTKLRKQAPLTRDATRGNPDVGTKRGTAGGLVERWGWVVLVVVPFLVYAKTLSFGITQLDDFIFIFTKDAFNKELSNLTRIFSTGVFSEKDIYYRPLFLATFILERLAVNVESPDVTLRLYHFTNIALHCGCAVLVWRFLQRLGVSLHAALALALLFAVHPALTMAVAWIPGRNDTLLTLFTLGFFINLHAYLLEYDKKHLFWQFLFLSCAVFTKETAVFIPAVATLFLWGMHAKPFGKRSVLVHVTWVPVMVMWYALRSNVLDKTQDERTLDTVVSDALQRTPAYLVYIGKAMLPFNLSVFPSLDGAPLWFGLVAITSLVVLVFFTYLHALKHNKKSDGLRVRAIDSKTVRFGLLGAGWFVAFVAPFLLVPPNVNDQLFEHRLYLPMVGLMILLGHTVLFNGAWSLKRMLIGSSLVVALFAVLVTRYLPLFEGPVVFWENAVAASPNSSYAHKLLGARYNETGNKEKALVHFKRAYALNKKEKHARYFIARDELLPAGRQDEAMTLLHEEIKLNPTYTEAYFQLSHVYFQQNRMDSTLKYLLLSREHQPLDPMINNNLLLTFIRTGDYAGAKNQMAYMSQNGLTVDGGAAAEVDRMKR